MNKIVIVGGGSAGWMTAASLIHNFPEKEIVVVDADSPTVGVGESTLQFIRIWMHSLGIKDEDWMDECNATYKTSIRFENWDGKHGHFHYPFGEPVIEEQFSLDLYNFARLDGDVPNSEWAEVFYPAAVMAEKGKLIERMPGWDLHKNSAYHFDAIKFAQWLKNKYCLPKGVKLIQDGIADIDVGVDGIEKMHGYLDINRGKGAIKADLYIDCTGFDAVLANAVGMKFIDYSHGLPNDSAWATQLPETDPNQFYTNCTTLNNGWVWNIPTKERTGTGYVFSSRYVTDDGALAEFKNHINPILTKHKGYSTTEQLNFKLLKWTQGRRNKFAHKNVVAVGLASGFIEPLESNGLFLTHETLKELIKAIGRGSFRCGDKNGFNYAMCTRFDDFADFVSMHYQYSTREDTSYWRDAHKYKLTNKALDKFYKSVYADSRVNPRDGHFNSIAFGLGINTVSNYDAEYAKMFDGMDMVSLGKEHREYLLARKNEWSKLIDENSI